MQVGWIKIGDFWQITGYISKTVQDRRTVFLKVEEEVAGALSNGDIADNIEWPLSAPNYPNLYILHRFSYIRNNVVRNFKFGLQVNGSKSQPVDDKSSLKEAWSWSRDTFNRWRTVMSWTWKYNEPEVEMSHLDSRVWHFPRYDTIRDAILTCARKPT